MNNQSNNQNVVPNVANPNNVVSPTPMPAPAQNYNAAQMPAQPNVQPVQPAQQPVQQPVQQPSQVVQSTPSMQTPASLTGASPKLTIPPAPSPANPEEVTVVNTTKTKGSNIILIIFLALLILFVFNIDTVLKYYDNYVKTGSLTIDTDSANTDNLVNGYILIDDSTGSIKLENINFYNFRKSGNLVISLNYLSSVDYSDTKTLGLYIELYNSSKELIYKGLFDTNGAVEKNSVRLYDITLDNYVYTNAYYALVKKYTSEDENAKTTLTCSLNDDNVSYSIVYNFNNNSLVNYSVDKSIKNNTVKSELDNEYNSVSSYVTATYANNKLSYTVDLNNIDDEFNPLYLYGTTPKVVSVKEELKKWKCE